MVKLDFLGANADVKPVGEAKSGGVVSYFTGKPEDWQAGLPTYSRIVYRDLWPGIDLAYSGTVNRLKYEFIVQPGADPSQVRLAYRGIDGLSVDEEGRLEVKTPAGGFRDDIPLAFQGSGDARKSVSLRYKLRGPGEGGLTALSKEKAGKTALPTETWGEACAYGFEVGDYDPTLPLVLDPAAVYFCRFHRGKQHRGWPRHRGGRIGERLCCRNYRFDRRDLSRNGRARSHPEWKQRCVCRQSRCFRSSLVYCGYIGGSANDYGRGIAVDASGNAYVTGYTLSTETSFPVVAGYDMTHNGLNDAFVAKVNAAGDALVYCTYIGGSADDYGYGIAVDGSGNAYIVGDTGSSEVTFCEITGPDLSYNGDATDAFVCKLNAAGTGRYYCGYIGGASWEHGNGIAVDALGNAYVAGTTNSTAATFPEVVGPGLTSWAYGDAFVAKVDPSGTALVYCGYIAGSGADTGEAIAVDSRGNAYVAGFSQGALPVIVGPDLTPGGSGDAFVAKVSAIGDALVYCGYIGGSGGEFGRGVAVDPSGNAYVTG